MATKLPYIVAPGSASKILAKIKQAQTPERFTQDFLSTILGFKGGNHRQFIPLAKKMGLLGTDGKPSDLYRQFRNPSESGAAIAAAMRIGYRDLFERNEYAGNLTKEQLKGLVVEITGLNSNDRVVQLICQTFEELKKLADFQSKISGRRVEEETPKPEEEEEPATEKNPPAKLGLSYTINLVLPKTDDPAVFNAIFRTLKENLLR